MPGTRFVNWMYHYYSKQGEVLQNEEIDGPGIYILGICKNNEFYPRYVGSSKNIRTRIIDHENGDTPNQCVADLMNRENRINVIIKYAIFDNDLNEILHVEKYFIYGLSKKYHDLCNKDIPNNVVPYDIDLSINSKC